MEIYDQDFFFRLISMKILLGTNQTILRRQFFLLLRKKEFDEKMFEIFFVEIHAPVHGKENMQAISIQGYIQSCLIDIQSKEIFRSSHIPMLAIHLHA